MASHDRLIRPVLEATLVLEYRIPPGVDSGGVAHHSHELGDPSGRFAPQMAQSGRVAVVGSLIVSGVVGLLPQLMYLLVALWLVAVSVSLMFRSEAGPQPRRLRGPGADGV